MRDWIEAAIALALMAVVMVGAFLLPALPFIAFAVVIKWLFF
jgi:hypothetical protein